MRDSAVGCRLLALGCAALLAGPARAAEEPVERITLQAAIERGVAKNPSVAVAREEVQRVAALVREVRAGALPTLTGNAVYTRLDAERQSANAPPGSQPIAGRDQLSANVQLAVPLVNTKTWVAWEHASDQVRVAELTAVDTRRQVALAVARAYLAVVTQHKVIEVDDRARTTAQAHLDFTATRLRGGVGNKLDEVRAGQEVASALAQLEGARATLARAQETLGVLTAAEKPLDTTSDMQLPDAGPLDKALESMESARPDLLALRERKTAADRVLRDSWADYVPLLNATAQPFYSTPATAFTPNTGWQVQVLLSVPFYDGGLRYGLHDERKALAAQARENLDGALRQARADVRGAFTVVLRADDALQAAREGARLANEALALASLAYKQGAVTNLEVIDAERRARDAETTTALAEDTARQARLDLLTAAGTFP